MPANKVEMSLDDIIKANKNKATKNNRSGKRGGRAGPSTPQRKTRSFAPKATGRGVQKRSKGRVVTPQRRNVNRLRKNFTQKSKPVASRPRINKLGVAKATAVATHKLVQKLVKKALAQRNVRNTISTVNAKPSNIRRRGGVRLVKKTVILNRVSPKSRVINQRRRIQPATVKTVAVRGRGPIRFNTNPQTVVHMVSPSPIRRNFVSRQRKFVNPRPIIVQQPVQQRQGRQAYRLVKVPANNRVETGSVRQQISAMRRQVVYTSPPQQQFRQQPLPQRFRQQPQQITYVQQQQPQRRRFQGNNNNRRNRGQQKNYSPFFEPQNYLQRIPVQQTTGGRRFVQ